MSINECGGIYILYINSLLTHAKLAFLSNNLSLLPFHALTVANNDFNGLAKTS